MGCFQKAGIVFLLKAILQLILFILFLRFFGIPSMRTFQKKDTLVLKYEEDTGGIEAPAVTIQAIQNGSGWKSPGVGKVHWKSFEIFQHCAEINLTIEECVQKDTIELTDFLKDVRFGDEPNVSVSVLNSSLFKEDVTVTPWGRHFTFKYSRTMTQDAEKDCLKFVLDRNFTFNVFVHDEDFFLHNFNPLGPPKNSWAFEGNERSFYQELILTKQRKKNLDRRPCQGDPGYSFTGCVKENLSKQVFSK